MNIPRWRSVPFLITSFLLAVLLSAAVASRPAIGASDELDIADLVEHYGISVVAVRLTLEDVQVHPMTGPEDQTGGGSGFVVDEEGRIVTNFHVIAPALEEPDAENDTLEMRSGATISVSFIDQPDEHLQVRVLGANPDFDLALLEFVDPDKRPDVDPLPLGDSDEVRAGEKAVAIGSPFGLHASVTSGIVSAIERERPGLVGIEIPFIQTDAAINPGNSGGPLFNAYGEVIGINNAILAAGAGPSAFVGVGFAVPVNLLRDSMDELLEGGLSGVAAAIAEIPDRPRLGLSAALTVEDFPAAVHEELGLPEYGIVVTELSPDGPADRAGVEAPTNALMIGGQLLPVGGDIILAANGRETRQMIDLQQIVLEKEAGDSLRLTLWQQGEEREVEVTLEVIDAE